MGDVVVLIVAILIVGAAIAYLIRAKKRGNHCVGCPYNDCSSCEKAKQASCSYCDCDDGEDTDKTA